LSFVGWSRRRFRPALSDQLAVIRDLGGRRLWSFLRDDLQQWNNQVWPAVVACDSPPGLGVPFENRPTANLAAINPALPFGRYPRPGAAVALGPALLLKLVVGISGSRS